MPLTKQELEEASEFAHKAGSNWKRISNILRDTNTLIIEFDEDGQPLTAGQITARKNRITSLRAQAEASIASLDALIGS